MGNKVKGNLKGISQVDLKKIEKFFNEKVNTNEIIPLELAKSIYKFSEKIGRIIGILISREGSIEEVFVGDKNILYIPDLGRHRISHGRLRRLRLITTILKDNFELNSDYYTDLQKLRLDMVVGIKEKNGIVCAKYAYLVPFVGKDNIYYQTEVINNLKSSSFDFSEFISNIENELTSSSISKNTEESSLDIVLVGVYDKDYKRDEESIRELKELAISASYNVIETIIQKRDIDPKTILGRGKLEEIMLKCLSLGANTIVFDRELKPSQLRDISNITKLNVLDRSMIILDIFAKRATSSEGRLQVELASLKYNLPRLLEKNAGLSRLTGGIGSRGPGETKLEIGKRRMNDRIHVLEEKLSEISRRRELRQKRRKESDIPLISILGYTNAGKSTLFNALTQSNVFVEDKLFATLDTTRGKLCIVAHENNENFTYCNFVLSDTVGFIRDLPNELKTAFKATLDELYDASLLLHVVDASDKNSLYQYRSVVEILREMDLGDIPRIVVFNKCDLIDEEFDLETLEDAILNYVKVSAKTKQGFYELKSKILNNYMQGLLVY